MALLKYLRKKATVLPRAVRLWEQLQLHVIVALQLR